MSSKIKKSKYYTNINNYKNDVDFYEEFTVLAAQEKIAKLMEEQKISKAELAKKLNQSKAHVTSLLSDGRNLTLKTFGRVCFHLNAKIKDFEMSSIRVTANQNVYGHIQNNVDVSNSYKIEMLRLDVINKSFSSGVLENLINRSTKKPNSSYNMEDKDDFHTDSNVA